MATLSILNSPGPLPLKATFQAPTDGPVSFAVSGSVSSTTAGQMVGVQVLFDRGVAGTCSVFCNAANSHQTLIPALLQATIPGSGTLWLVGMAYSFTSSPIFCASTVSAQSKNRLACSGFRAPLMMAIEPTS